MLTAKDKSGSVVSTINVSREVAVKWKKGSFFCLVCNQPVRLKYGEIRMPHFAHVTADNCEFGGEGETPEHLALKAGLAEWCERTDLDYTVEAYLAKLKQRPDLLIGKLAIEIQCSTLSLEKMMQRSKNYLKHGYLPLWICGKKLWQSGKMTAKLKQFCGYSEKAGFYLWSADYIRRTLSFHYHIEETGNKTIHYQTQSWQFFVGSLGEIFERVFERQLRTSRKYEVKKEVIQAYKDTCKKLRRKEKNTLMTQKFCYERNLHLLMLHPWFYYSVNQSFPFKASLFPVKYQLWQWLSNNNQLSEKSLRLFLFQCILQQDILYDFPCISKKDLLCWTIHHLQDSLLGFKLVEIDQSGWGFLVKLPSTLVYKQSLADSFVQFDFSTVIITGTD